MSQEAIQAPEIPVQIHMPTVTITPNAPGAATRAVEDKTVLIVPEGASALIFDVASGGWEPVFEKKHTELVPVMQLRQIGALLGMLAAGYHKRSQTAGDDSRVGYCLGANAALTGAAAQIGCSREFADTYAKAIQS